MAQNLDSQSPSDFWRAVKTNIKLQRQAPAIQPLSQSENLPLSFAQERLWFLDQLQPGSSVYNMHAAFQLKGSLNVTALSESLSEIVRRHSILRTTFPVVDGQPVQNISPETSLHLPVIDLRELTDSEQEAEVQRLCAKEAEQSFDLTRGPLWRVKLVCLAQEEYVLFRTVHHIIFDGWSYSVFMRELAVLYKAFSLNLPSPLSELPIQYADFALFQRQWLQGEVLESLCNYWQQQLSGSISPLELPIDHPRPPVPTHRGAIQYLVVDKNLSEALKTLSYQQGVSLFITLLSAFKVLLHRYTGQEDIIVCSPIAGRHRIETKKLIGYFNNLVVMRTQLGGNPSFRELISRVSNVTLGACEHQDLPFQKLAELPNLVRTPLHRGMFALQNTPSQPLQLAGITSIPLEVGSEAADFDLFLSMREQGENLIGEMHYKIELFETTTMTGVLKHFQTLLESLVANPDQRLKDLPLLTVHSQASPLSREVGSSAKMSSSQLNSEIVLLSNHSSSREKRNKDDGFYDELELQLTKIWEEVLDTQPIGVKDNFFDLGGHSLLAVRLCTEIEKTFNKNLPLSTFFQAPTIERQANLLRFKGYEVPTQLLLPIQNSGSKPPLFCVYGILLYRDLAYHLGSERPVYGVYIQEEVELLKVGDLEEQNALTRVADLAALYLKEIRKIQPIGPYHLAGESFGGLVAFEMAQQLQSQGEEVAIVALFDTHAPGCRKMPLSKRAVMHLKKLLQEGPYYLIKKLKRRTHGRSDIRKQISRQAVSQYVPRPYKGKLILFRAMERDEFEGSYKESQWGWGPLAAEGLEVHHIPGDHLGILQEPHVQVLATKLKGCLDRL